MSDTTAKLGSDRRWPEWVKDRVRELHAIGYADCEIRVAMPEAFAPGTPGGAQVKHVRGRLLGLPSNTRFPRWPEWVRERVRELYAAGLNDREITEQMTDVFGPQGPISQWAVNNIRRKLGLPPVDGRNPKARRSTPGEKARIRELHAAGLRDNEIRDAMPDRFPAGRVGSQRVSQIRRWLGLPPNDPKGRAASERTKEAVRQLHAEGHDDAEIDRRLVEMIPGTAPWAGSACRYALGLPVNPAPPARAAAAREAQADAHREERAALARKWGLPDDLPPKEVEIVMALARGAMTTPAVAIAVGLPPEGRPGKKRELATTTGKYLNDLRQRGLVARLPVSGALRKRGPRYVQTLTAECLVMIRSAAERQLQEKTDDQRDAEGDGRGREGSLQGGEVGGDPVRETPAGSQR